MSTLNQKIEDHMQRSLTKANMTQDDLEPMLLDRPIFTATLKNKSGKELLGVLSLIEKIAQAEMIETMNMEELLKQGKIEVPVSELPVEMKLVREQKINLKKQLARITSEDFVKELDNVANSMARKVHTRAMLSH
jgi:hypothetical protein